MQACVYICAWVSVSVWVWVFTIPAVVTRATKDVEGLSLLAHHTVLSNHIASRCAKLPSSTVRSLLWNVLPKVGHSFDSVCRRSATTPSS